MWGKCDRVSPDKCEREGQLVIGTVNLSAGFVRTKGRITLGSVNAALNLSYSVKISVPFFFLFLLNNCESSDSKREIHMFLIF